MNYVHQDLTKYVFIRDNIYILHATSHSSCTFGAAGGQSSFCGGYTWARRTQSFFAVVTPCPIAHTTLPQIQRRIQGWGGSLGIGRTPLRPGVVVENARTACSEADPFPFCDF